MTAGHKWTHEESGALAYSQSNGNINVPEHALSRLVEERDRLRYIIRQIQWMGHPYAPCCPWCSASKAYGHKPDCAISAVLKGETK